MGMILYNPTQIKRKLINQVKCHDACNVLTICNINPIVIPIKLLQHRAILYAAPSQGLKNFAKAYRQG